MIDRWVRYYSPNALGGLVPPVEKLLADGRMRASRKVRDELERRHDGCFRWTKTQVDPIVDSDAQILGMVARPMGQYSNPVKPDKGISGADPFVIGLAAIGAPKPWAVVTGEKPGGAENPEIPWVCRNFKPQPIRVIGFLDLIVEDNWQLT